QHTVKSVSPFLKVVGLYRELVPGECPGWLVQHFRKESFARRVRGSRYPADGSGNMKEHPTAGA
ncbi:MAG TPA: hypothetical protein VK450_03770, partial [Methanomicrobiales archaeon]|nr:hypothetical protein [Methanomicrobiales archaeon]